MTRTGSERPGSENLIYYVGKIFRQVLSSFSIGTRRGINFDHFLLSVSLSMTSSNKLLILNYASRSVILVIIF